MFLILYSLVDGVTVKANNFLSSTALSQFGILIFSFEKEQCFIENLSDLLFFPIWVNSKGWKSITGLWDYLCQVLRWTFNLKFFINKSPMLFKKCPMPILSSSFSVECHSYMKLTKKSWFMSSTTYFLQFKLTQKAGNLSQDYEIIWAKFSVEHLICSFS